MIRPFVPLLLLLAPAASAQVMPMPGPGNMRMQTAEWREGEAVLLTILPGSGLTVILEEGQKIERITAPEGAPVAVRVTPEGNAFTIVPEGNISRAGLEVETASRSYLFTLRTQESPLAGLVVTFVEPGEPEPGNSTSRPSQGGLHSYRFRGSAAVRPVSVTDDTVRTFIEYALDQPLPAVFAIGPAGEEEVVNGHMRDGLFVIDRVYEELVFRIDRQRATARRNPAADPAS